MTDDLKKLRQEREIPEEARRKSREYAQMKKILKKALQEGSKTIPEISETTGIPPEQVTYYLMTLRKYHELSDGEIDDMDEYFFYQLPTK